MNLLGDPSRILPALIASQRATPDDYNASLRLAQMEVKARRYEDGLAACDRGLAHATGPVARAGLMEIKADALTQPGNSAEAQRILEQALPIAQEIDPKQVRDNNIRKISTALNAVESAKKAQP